MRAMLSVMSIGADDDILNRRDELYRRLKRNRSSSHAPRVKQLRVAHGDFEFLTYEETPRFLGAAAPEWKAFVSQFEASSMSGSTRT